MIYFVQGELTRRIKIGYATCLWRRITELQACSPDKLIVLGIILTDKRDGEFHALFAGDRAHGEWFEPSRNLLAFIQSNCVPAHSHKCARCVPQEVTEQDVTEGLLKLERYFKEKNEYPASLRISRSASSLCGCGKPKQAYQRMCSACFSGKQHINQ